MKRNFVSILAVLAACTMLFSACKKTETTSEPESQPTQQEEVAEPTPTPEPYEANVLTGEPKGDDYPEGQRITAVMVNNITVARPQRGLSKAQMLFEIKVEGGITRFMPVFNDYNDIEEIGPVRSGRDQFFQLILPWQALYIHEGESVFMTEYAKNYEYGLLNNTDAANGYRDYDRVNWQGLSYGNGLSKEHTMYTSGENIAKYISDMDVDMNRTYNSTFFNFVDYRDENPVRDLTNSPDSAYSDKYGPVVQDGEYVAITHSASYKTRFLYDEATTTYKMQQYYSTDGSWRDTIDEEYDEQLAFTNLVILYTDFEAYPGDSHDIQDVEYGNGGIGYYCYGGKIEKIYWQKGTPLEALRLYYLTEDGQCSDEQLPVNIGKSYVAVVDVDEAVNLQTGTLADYDLSKSDAATTEQVVDEEAVEAGEGATDSVGDYVD
ncbi:DUF3048 domain-containing protein [Subdoligranulum sp. DSM 109015]|uniref:DUF3048 domain-containing protein n=1 Tax=Gemmiger gallinarum TaxID=2779354 RepID=A0ABR9R5C9_9FIRM|nr:DUF3048 domain-containing protein [Gemmiger gallinarum]MBE5038363.1 DUF3048 domain-containing protein [Gemmiger gallinarum]